MYVYCWNHAEDSIGLRSGHFISASSNKKLYVLCIKLWFHFFKKPLDQLDSDRKKVLEHLRRYFFECKWYEVYDFIEFVANNYKRVSVQESFIKICNNLFEKEISGYRFVGGMITKITEKKRVKK